MIAPPDTAFLRAILDHVAHPIFVKDRLCRFVYVNKALSEMVQIDGAEILGKTDYDLFPKEQADFFREKDLATLAGQTVVIEEEPITDAAGGRHVLSTTKTPLFDEQGQVSHIVGIIHDISRLKQAEEGLRKSNDRLHELDRLKSELLANVSHEFRTPLTLNLAPLEELLAESLSPDVLEQVRLIYRNSLRLLHLVNNLLDYARLEAGHLQPKFQPVDVGALTRRLCESFTTAFARKGLEFVVTDQAQGVRLFVDPEIWEKIVFNLLANALKFTEQGQVRVAISAPPSEGVVLLQISDTGPGIPKEDLPRIFERFHKSGRSTEGAGIGLSLVAEGVRLHGGVVSVASEEGKGARFQVRLPLGPDPGRADTELPPSTLSGWRTSSAMPEAISGTLPARPSPTLPVPALSLTSPARILVVDDNRDMREYLVRLLSPLGLVTAAETGLAGLKQAMDDPPDLVVTDVMMPELDGFALCERLRAEKKTAAVAVILLTARTDVAERVRGLSGGADDYVLKPFSPAELRERVRLQLQLHNARREVQGLLTQRSAEMQTILENLGEGVMIWDQSGTLTMANEAALLLTGVSSGSVSAFAAQVKLSVLRGATLGPLALVDNPIQKALLGHTTRDLEVRLENSSKNWTSWVLLSAAPLPAGLPGVVSTLHDITRLKEAERLKDEFLSVASHELRTPLAGLQLLVGLLRTHIREKSDSSVLLPLLDREERLLQRLNRLVHDILDMSRIQLGKLSSHPILFDLASLVREVVERVSAIQGERHKFSVTHGPNGPEVSPEFGSEFIWVRADADRLDQVISNVLANACKYAPTGSVIHVTMYAKGAYAQVSVRDQGPGIPPEMTERIFDRFFQVEAAAGRAFGGLGLGLYISRELVQSQGGKIWVESEPGKGSTFHFTVPLAGKEVADGTGRG